MPWTTIRSEETRRSTPAGAHARDARTSRCATSERLTAPRPHPSPGSLLPVDPPTTSRPDVRRRRTVARLWAEFLAEYPLVVSPVWTQPASPHGFDIESAETAAATMRLLRPVDIQAPGCGLGIAAPRGLDPSHCHTAELADQPPCRPGHGHAPQVLDRGVLPSQALGVIAR
jgi:hypothetical protein